jgi:hypothetical protein
MLKNVNREDNKISLIAVTDIFDNNYTLQKYVKL